MAGKNIKGITIEFNGSTVKLNKALKEAEGYGKNLEKQLKDVDKALQLDPKNTELLSQKQRILSEQIENTKEKLDLLRQAEEKAAKSVGNYDDWKAAFDPIKEQIDQTKKRLTELSVEQKKLERAGKADTQAYQDIAKEADALKDNLKDLHKQADTVTERFGEPIPTREYEQLQTEIAVTAAHLNSLEAEAKTNFEKIGDSAATATSKFRVLGDAAETVKTKAQGIAEKFKPATTAVVGLATAAAATVPATEDLRDDLSKLDANARDNAVSVDVARKAWKEFAIQSGETDSAVEAISNLLQADFTESNLQKAVEGLAGAAQRFPDTLKVESLADSLQETLATSEATGQFSELLSRLGFNVDVFNESLAACTTEAEKQDLVLRTLADAGLNESYEAWKRNNEEMLANKDANLELQLSMAELAEVCLPVVTDLTSVFAEFVSWFANLPEGAKMAVGGIALFLGAISPVASAVGGAADIVERLSKVNLPGLEGAFGKISGMSLPGLKNAFSSAFGFIVANPIPSLIAAAAGLVLWIGKDGDEIQAKLGEVDGYLQNVFAQDWTEVFGPVLGGILNGFLSYLENWWNFAFEVFNGGIDFIRGVFTGDWERAWEGVKGVFSGILDGMLALVGLNLDDVQDAFKTGIEKVKGFFSGWEWKWPKLKMPHFSVSGSFDFSSFPPSVPKIAVDWYAKGCILNGAQIFGMLGNRLLGGGEAGREAVLPLDSFYAHLEGMLGNVLGSSYAHIGSMLTHVLSGTGQSTVLSVDGLGSLKDTLAQLVGKYGSDRPVTVQVHIEHFENNTDRDLDDLADDLAERIEFRKQQVEAGLA